MIYKVILTIQHLHSIQKGRHNGRADSLIALQTSIFCADSFRYYSGIHRIHHGEESHNKFKDVLMYYWHVKIILFTGLLPCADIGLCTLPS